MHRCCGWEKFIDLGKIPNHEGSVASKIENYVIENRKGRLWTVFAIVIKVSVNSRQDYMVERERERELSGRWGWRDVDRERESDCLLLVHVYV